MKTITIPKSEMSIVKNKIDDGSLDQTYDKSSWVFWEKDRNKTREFLLKADVDISLSGGKEQDIYIYVIDDSVFGSPVFSTNMEDPEFLKTLKEVKNAVYAHTAYKIITEDRVYVQCPFRPGWRAKAQLIEGNKYYYFMNLLKREKTS